MADEIVVRAFGQEASEHDVSALESRAEIQPKEWLLAKKREVVREWTELDAMYKSNGHGSPSEAARKRHRALISQVILDEIKARNEKEPSEAALERMANAHRRHRAFCQRQRAETIRYNVLCKELEELEYRLWARDSELRAYSAETRNL